MIGLFTIGGGYAMIPLMESETVSRGWLSLDELIKFFAIAESTPGPFAVNTATLIGFQQQGILGGIIATTGVVLPSFIIIVIIAKYVNRFIENAYFNKALSGIKAVVTGMIFAVVIELSITSVFSKDFFEEGFDFIALFIMIVILVLVSIKKKFSPILIIIISGVLGMICYSLWGLI